MRHHLRARKAKTGRLERLAVRTVLGPRPLISDLCPADFRPVSWGEIADSSGQFVFLLLGELLCRV